MGSLYSQGPFCLSPHPTREQAGDAQGVGTGHNLDGWPQLIRGIFHTIWYHAQNITTVGKQKEWENVQSHSNCLPKLPLHVMESSFPGDGWIPTCTWEAVKEFFILLCLYEQFLLYLWNCLYQKPQVFSVLLSWFSPTSHPRGVNEWLSGAQLPSGFKPWHKLAHFLAQKAWSSPLKFLP